MEESKKMKFAIKDNKYYLNETKLEKLISYNIDSDNGRTKLTIELILDDLEINSTKNKE